MDLAAVRFVLHPDALKLCKILHVTSVSAVKYIKCIFKSMPDVQYLCSDCFVIVLRFIHSHVSSVRFCMCSSFP